MKIELTIHDKKYSVESEHDEHTINEMAEIFRGLLVTSGYHPASVDALFDPCTIEPWILPEEIDIEKV